jgi:hypothetical protein
MSTGVALHTTGEGRMEDTSTGVARGKGEWKTGAQGLARGKEEWKKRAREWQGGFKGMEDMSTGLALHTTGEGRKEDTSTGVALNNTREWSTE